MARKEREMIDDATIQRLQELEKAATPGPWTSENYHMEDGFPLPTDEMVSIVETVIRNTANRGDGSPYLNVVGGESKVVCFTLNGPTSPENAALIASMRNALPTLLLEIVRLREELAAAQDEEMHWRSCYSTICDECKAAQDANDKLSDENAHLRAEIAEYQNINSTLWERTETVTKERDEYKSFWESMQ